MNPFTAPRPPDRTVFNGGSLNHCCSCFSFMLLSWFAHLYLINLLLKAATVVWLVLVLKDTRT